AAVAFSAQHVQQRPMRYLKSRAQSLRWRIDQASKGLLVPIDKILFGWLPFECLFPIASCLFLEFQVLDGMFGRLRHDPTPVVEPLASSPSGNLVKIPGSQNGGFLSVKLAQTGQEHGPDRHVHARSQSVSTADNFEQPLLSELLHQHTVLGQE